MFGNQKDTQENLMDTNSPPPRLPLNKGEAQGGGLSYTKTSKLITALYMVTDMMDREEPLRTKLRTLGVDIISDIYSNFSMQTYHLNKIISKIDEILSFLDIAGALNLISGMNSSILKKEFLALKQPVQVLNPDSTLSEFFQEPSREIDSIRHNQPTRIGVQKGSTLMKALSGVEVSDRIPDTNVRENFNILKKERREEIISIIKLNPNGLTITDIKSKAQGVLVSCGEKTLQRELVSMVKDNILSKTGLKRWSRYYLK